MLLSPGNSPRHLTTPSPSQTPHSLSSTSSSKPTPSSNTSQSPTVLDEDTYVAAIEKIIERDYFPDIPKLRDRLDWLTATNTRDPVLIRDAQLKIIDRRLDNDHAADATPDVTAMGLDQFLRRFTSEDNVSFAKIMDKVDKKRKDKYGHTLLLDGKEGGTSETSKREKVGTDGYGTGDQPVSTLEGWKYNPTNALMYIQSGEAPLTEEERVRRVKDAASREITKGNTRFHGMAAGAEEMVKPQPEAVSVECGGMTPVVVSEREREKRMRYDLEDLRRTPQGGGGGGGRFYVESEKKAENGYAFVKTPSPAPGVEESPFITWGEIEGTPLRLEPEDTPVDIGGSGEGPMFKIPCPPTRDLKAHSLSREAARKIKERSKLFERKPPLPSPLRSGSASPSVRNFSPAAKKFMRSAMAKTSSSVDESLRASYRGNSPALATPKSVGRSLSTLSRDASPELRSPSVREGSNPPW